MRSNLYVYLYVTLSDRFRGTKMYKVIYNLVTKYVFRVHVTDQIILFQVPN